MSEHNKLPWRGVHGDIYSDDEGAVALMVQSGKAEANSAFIVRAVNSHAALVEALKWVVNHPGECLGDYPTVLCRCKDALKLAEGLSA